eukprot:1139081-Pelagomonas_calceolata.AAC.2
MASHRMLGLCILGAEDGASLSPCTVVPVRWSWVDRLLAVTGRRPCVHQAACKACLCHKHKLWPSSSALVMIASHHPQHAKHAYGHQVQRRNAALASQALRRRRMASRKSDDSSHASFVLGLGSSSPNSTSTETDATAPSASGSTASSSEGNSTVDAPPFKVAAVIGRQYVPMILSYYITNPRNHELISKWVWWGLCAQGVNWSILCKIKIAGRRLHKHCTSTVPAVAKRLLCSSGCSIIYVAHTWTDQTNIRHRAFPKLQLGKHHCSA